MAGMTDGDLLSRFAAGRDAGGEAAFAALVARHGPMVLGVCRHRLGDRHAADDAFQAVFLVLSRRAGSIRRPDLLGPWLHGVATRVARKAQARAGRLRRREEPGREGAMRDVLSIGDGVEARSSRDEEAAAVHEEVGRLPERYRRAVVLCHFEGLTHAEAARRLGCAPGTVGSLVSRARDLLRVRLARRGLTAAALATAGAIEARAAAVAVPTALARATIGSALSYAAGRASAAGVASTTAVELAEGTLRAMTLGKLAVGGALLVALGAVGIASGGRAAGGAAPDDPRPPVGQPGREQTVRASSPGLPGAVSRPPDWLVKDAPFDVAAFFAAPPDEDNAATRYLDALLEFDPAMAACFPEGPDRESRQRAAERRSVRLSPVYQSWTKDPRSVTAETMDAVLDAYDTGFRKLDWAQQRPRCVFQTGLGVTARVPHAHAANAVARVAALKVRRELERGEFDAVLRDLARLQRLSRDLLPCAGMVAVFVHLSLDRIATEQIVVPMLSAPGMTVDLCDRILALLADHERRSIDAYTECLRGEYVQNRVTLRDLIVDQARLRKEWDSFGNPAGPSIVAEVAEPVLFAMAGNGPLPQPGVGERLGAMARQMMALKNIPDLDARVAADDSRGTGPTGREDQRVLRPVAGHGGRPISRAIARRAAGRGRWRPWTSPRGSPGACWARMSRSWRPWPGRRGGRGPRRAWSWCVAGSSATAEMPRRRSRPPRRTPAGLPCRSIPTTAGRSGSRSSAAGRRFTPSGWTDATTAGGSDNHVRPRSGDVVLRLPAP